MTPLGKLLESTEERDAIHIAIAPVIASEKLLPGQDVGFVKDANCEIVGPSDTPIGIIDPFLRGCVSKGERCWLMLYPNTIKSLRHEWVHPAFGADDPAKAMSKAWMENYASEIGQSYEDTIYHATEYLDHSEYLCEGGRYEGEYVPDEFWDHFQRITGRMVDSNDRGSFFSCSC